MTATVPGGSASAGSVPVIAATGTEAAPARLPHPPPRSPAAGPRSREWRPPYAVDLAGVLAPLRRGRGDPTWHSTDGSAV